MNFESDNTAPAHDAVLDAMRKYNEGCYQGYGADALTARVNAKICEIFECDADVLLVPTGTAANAIGIAAMMETYGMVLCHQNAHIQVDECGAPEMFCGGAKTIALPGDDGKLGIDVLQGFLQTPWQGVVHRTQPMVLSVTQLSESGTAYSVDETKALASFAHAQNMKLHMDGARFANAMVGLDATPAAMTWQSGVDLLAFGATKNGTYGCEAIVAFDKTLGQRLGFLRKRGGHLLSKMRMLSAQFIGYLEDDLWIDNARHANRMATVLANGLSAIDGVSLLCPVDGNQIFAQMPAVLRAHLRAHGFEFLDWPDAGSQAVRLVCSWNTSPKDVSFMIDCASTAQTG